MTRTIRIVIIVLLLLLSIGCDQAAKGFARQELRNATPRSLFGGWIKLKYAENPGAFLSIGADLPAEVRHAFTLLLWTAVTAGIFLLIAKAEQLSMTRLVASALLVAGGCGNLIDRLLHQGRVVDFLIVGRHPMHTAIFNIADMLILLGGVMLLVTTLVSEKASDRAPD
jgi:signal peptidase II